MMPLLVRTDYLTAKYYIATCSNSLLLYKEKQDTLSPAFDDARFIAQQRCTAKVCDATGDSMKYHGRAPN